MARVAAVLCAALVAATACGGGAATSEAGRIPVDTPCAAELPAGELKGKPLTGGFVRALDIERALSASMPASTGNHEEMTSAVFVDTDGDGRGDLVMTHSRFGAFVARNLGGGRFEDATPLMPDLIGGCSHLADLDGDGAVDMICSRFSMRVRFSDSGKFDGPGELAEPPIDSPGPMTTLAWDVDEDGLLDLVVSPFGSPKRVARNRGDRTFEQVGAHFGLDVGGLTWATSFVDLDGDGRDDVYVMNDGPDKSNYALRRLEPGPDGDPRFAAFEPVAAGCDRSGFFGPGGATPMGLALADLVGDGTYVMHVANAAPTPLLRRDPRGLRFVHESMLIVDGLTTTRQFLVPWSPVFWDADHDGLVDLLLPTGDDRGFHEMGGRGESFVLFHHARSVSSFEELHASIGLESPGHFMTVTLADYDGDGDLDLLAGGFAQAVRVYENKIAAGPHVLTTLRGHLSNPHGLGARMRVTTGGHARTYFVGDRFHPQASTVPPVDVTLADANGALFEIDWPSGYHQVVRGVTAGARLIEEPELVTTTPATRHVPADGMTPATIRVRPVDEEGHPLAATVSIETPFAEASATPVGPVVVAEDGSATREFVASKPGSAVVVIKLNDVALRVRPRIWFDAP